MDMQNVIYAVAVLFIMGIVFAILLGVAAKVFAVEVDERVPLVRECLPGANCGGCGFPGCDGLAAAIVEGRAPVNGCPECNNMTRNSCWVMSSPLSFRSILKSWIGGT